LYRADQNSYILYPNKKLPKFLEKNTIPKDKVEKSSLLKKLLENGNLQLINQDIKGGYHFNGNFHNANDLKEALAQLSNHQEYKELVETETSTVLQIFEDVFNHKAFTGRSGTFYGYEGLGSIYWHMVSKLHLAVFEVTNEAINKKESKDVINSLITHFEEIGNGIGVHKSPDVYGAFPTDPYSHTPLNKGAQQPGMTGQVKEDILTRIGELGVKMNNGKLQFQPNLLHDKEFLSQVTEATFIQIDGTKKILTLEKDSLAFTVCQVPVVYKKSLKDSLELHFNNGTKETYDTLELDDNQSRKIFNRTGEISNVMVFLNDDYLK
jgi:hypothetical protein